jgi:hypothetical protein
MGGTVKKALGCSVFWGAVGLGFGIWMIIHGYDGYQTEFAWVPKKCEIHVSSTHSRQRTVMVLSGLSGSVHYFFK